MRKTSVVAASMLVLSGAMLANVTVAQAPMVKGQVTKIDESAGKITLKHGPIKKLDMNEGMTMVFRVQDPAMLKQVKAGDKVKFDADKINGQFTVTKIEKAKGRKDQPPIQPASFISARAFSCRAYGRRLPNPSRARRNRRSRCRPSRTRVSP